MRDNRQRRSRRTDGVILSSLHRVSAWLYSLILNSFFGRLLTGFRDTEQALSEGPLYTLTRSRRKRSDRLSFRFRHRLSALLEKSWFYRAVGVLEQALLRTSVNTYGVFLLFFGCYAVVTYYVLSSVSDARVSFSYAVTGGVLILSSLPLFASPRPLAYTLRHSTVLRFLLIRVFGIADERLAAYGEKGKEHYLEALVLAIASGSLIFWISPLYVLLGMVALVLVMMIFRDPEVGMILSLFATPFLGLTDRPTMILLALVGVSLLSYGVKLLCGKRVLRMQAMDWMILLFLALMLFGGVFTHGGQASLRSAITYVGLGSMYFMVANLVRTQEGVSRVLGVLLTGGFVVALLGICQYVFSTPSLDYLDLRLFSDLGGRVSSTWGNPNILGEYLILLLPLSLCVILLQPRLTRALGTGLLLVALSACLVFTWSRGAWVGALISVILLLLSLDHRMFSWAVVGVIPMCALLQFSPEMIVRRFTSITSTTDSSILYRLYLWEGVRNMLGDYWLTGVGVGESAFCAVYSGYALSGIESAMHSHNLYLQIICGIGVVGLVVFALSVLLWLQRALEYYRFARLRTPRLVVAGGVAGIVALLVMGCFDEVWYNYRIYMLFWALAGLVTAQIRVGERQTERAHNPVEDDRTQGEVVFHFE